MRAVLPCTAVLLLVNLSWVFTLDADLAPVPLCRALESVQPGDKIPIIVRGIYAVDYLYSLDLEHCESEEIPQTCVEFSPDVELSRDFEKLHDSLESGRVAVTFLGILYGPQRPEVPPVATDVPVEHRRWARNSMSKWYCGNRFTTKLIVKSVLSYEAAALDVPWPGQNQPSNGVPPPISIAIPRYPPIARNVEYEGVVLVAVTISDGKVVDAQAQFGDDLLVKETLENVKSWRFEPGVQGKFTVEYDYRLENALDDDELNEIVELRLPKYIRIVGRRKSL